MKVLCLFFLCLVAISCSKKKSDEPKFTLEEFMQKAHETTPVADKSDSIQFQDYSPGVNKLESKALSYERLPFFAISFETQTQARLEAMRLNQYYARNWLFDRVEGEPVLEDYVIETFGAINPKRSVQRKPKKHEAGHGEAAPGGHATPAPAHH